MLPCAGDLRDPKSTSGSLLCAVGPHTWTTHVRSSFMDVQEANRSSHSGAESEIASIYSGSALQIFECVLETLSCETAKGNFERPKRDRVIPSHSHPCNCAFETIDNVPHNIPNNSHSTHLLIFQDNAAVIQGRSPNLRHVTRTHRVDLDWLFDRVNLDPSILIKNVRTNDCNSDHPMNQVMSAASLANPSLAHLLGKPQAMSQVMTQPEKVDQIWSQYASKVSRSGCALDGHLTWEF